MSDPQSTVERTRQQVTALAKHLPPSAADLHLLDINGSTGAILRELRADLHITRVTGRAHTWDLPPGSVDAVVGLDLALDAGLLAAALAALRPGGRFVIVNGFGTVHEATGRRIEAAGYTRILVEAAPVTPDGEGVLMRGEKPHLTADTLARVRQVAGADADALDLATYRGRYVYLLVEQQPNLPPWRTEPDAPVTWQALAVAPDGAGGDRGGEVTPVLLAFSSLPKAVGFMQPAVLQGTLGRLTVNKVGKFSRATAARWPLPVLLNPPLANVEGAAFVQVPVDPATAEAPDE